MMLLLDAIIRFSAVALLILLTALAYRDARQSKPALFAGFLSLSAAALLMGTPHPELQLPLIPHTIVRFLDIPSVVFAWWFGRSLFEDDFRLGKFEWTVMIVLIIPITLFRLDELGFIASLPPWLIFLSSGTSIVLMSHLIVVTLNGRHDDMIESRRKVRIYFLLALALATIIILISERVLWQQYPIEVNTLRAAITLMLALWGTYWMLGFQVEKLSFEPAGIKEKPSTDANSNSIDPRDAQLYSDLIEQMNVHHIYTEPGLSITALAAKLNAPEHHLRALINQGLGYRNFSGFINHYRIESVKASMQDINHARTPILTLAMNVGFNSLAPFNRAFLKETQLTPTEFRRQHQNKLENPNH